MSYAINTEAIKKLRHEHQLTLAEVASAIGLTRADQYLRLENGQYQFKATELPALAHLYEVPIETFFIEY
ncbi:helix-turn-helix transcriptional regulator [Lacticaseibacillus hulanensis]|uniref:helix-turn-helix transcriptional regulator n=1 Tax=Lacticaseibacillus hulanensis TaxID=2493111 RepID=UPI001F4ECDCE|nr:helix-turn-helix transcriptional regulator [Lacticaseibacillus hulanensis]